MIFQGIYCPKAEACSRSQPPGKQGRDDGEGDGSSGSSHRIALGISWATQGSEGLFQSRSTSGAMAAWVQHKSRLWVDLSSAVPCQQFLPALFLYFLAVALRHLCTFFLIAPRCSSRMCGDVLHTMVRLSVGCPHSFIQNAWRYILA